MKNLVTIVLLFISAQLMAQTKSKTTTPKDTANRNAVAKSTTAKPIYGLKPVNRLYGDSALKYRELAMYYASHAKGPKDSTAQHYQKLAIAFQRKHFQLNKAALVYNYNLMENKHKQDLEKKYKTTIN